jgi:hypothetical protein
MIVAMLIGVVNVFSFKEIWFLLAAITILVILAIYAVREKHMLQSQAHS